jgi:ribulose-phosphate 3-epimerase
MSKIAPSILAADTMRMGEAAHLICDAGADYVHFDVMDGVFVPNISFGPQLLRDMKAEIDMYFDVHLMLTDPLPYVDVFAQSGAGGITVHVEAQHFAQSLDRIRALGLRVGASLRPGTPAGALADVLASLDLVLVMTVEPGFGGQTFNAAMLSKIRDLRAMGFAGEIEVDGGINMDNAPLLAAAGADTLVMGTSFFRASDAAALVRAVHAL